MLNYVDAKRIILIKSFIMYTRANTFNNYHLSKNKINLHCL